MLDAYFSKLKSDIMGQNRGVFFDRTDEHGPIVFVEEYSALVQVVGYVKYQSASNVLMRGQGKCYGCMKPSVYRGHTSREIDVPLEELLQHYRLTTELDRSPLERVTTEPLLQHYGLRTKWIDLVDSLAHALFFAAYDMVRGAETYSFIENNGQYGYVHLVDCGTDRELSSVKVLQDHRVTNVPGLWETSDGFSLCDLRRAKPSKALRPHAQHGYLCRPPVGECDLWNRVLLRIAFAPEKARSWIGNGTALGAAELFPDPKTDRVFGRLLGEQVSGVFKELASRYPKLNFGEIFRFSFH